ncbi:MAG: hypothetical protein WD716_05720 [Fimbriimonadaceae bacterium]
MLDPIYKRTSMMHVPGVLDWYENYIIQFPSAPIDAFWCTIHLTALLAAEGIHDESPLPHDSLVEFYDASQELLQVFPDVSDLVSHLINGIRTTVYCEVNEYPKEISAEVAWAAQALLIRSYEALSLAAELFKRRCPDYHYLVAASAEACFRAAHIVKEPSSITDFQRGEAIESYEQTRRYQTHYSTSRDASAPNIDGEVARLRKELDSLGVRCAADGTVFKGQYRQYDVPDLVRSRYGDDTFFKEDPYMLFAHVFRTRNKIAHSLYKSWPLYLKMEERRIVASSSLRPAFMDSFSFIVLAHIMRVFDELGRGFGEEMATWCETMWKVYHTDQLNKAPVSSHD